MNLMNSAAASAPADDDHGLSPLKSNHPASNFINNSSNSFVTGSSDSSSFHEPMASNSWMTESVWAPPNLLSIIAGQELEDFPPPPQAMATPSASHQRCFEENNGDNIGVHNSGGGCSLYNDELVISRDLKRPPPIGRQQQQQQNRQHQQQQLLLEQQHYPQPQMNSSAAVSVDHVYQQPPPPFRRESGDRHYRLIVLKQPEEQHRARYASEGSRGAIKDRAGTSFCAIQLFGNYRPTRVELFAAERNFQHGRPAFVQHSQYKLIPVAGKSSTITPCKRITAEDGSERLEVILRPENRMIGILDSIGIMKICSYVSSEGKRPKRRKQRKMCGGDDSAEDQQSNIDGLPQNSMHIVCRAFIPLNDESDCGERITRFEVLQAVTEPIRCVQQLGTPDLLKMSLESSPSLGGQELFLIGRNFDPKDTKILFREYRNDGSLGWSAEAVIDRRFLHQCHIVCVVPAYHNIYSNATVSVTVICGTKQSHPKSFTYTACEREDDDDWRPPDCSNATDFQGAGGSSSKSQQKTLLVHRQQQQQFSGSHLFGGESFGREGHSLSLAMNNAEQQRGPSQHYQHF